jgi:hypothetical protein
MTSMLIPDQLRADSGAHHAAQMTPCSQQGQQCNSSNVCAAHCSVPRVLSMLPHSGSLVASQSGSSSCCAELVPHTGVYK